MKLVLDNIVFSLQSAGGISTYWAELARRLIKDNYEASFVERENNNVVRRTLPIQQERIISDSSYPLLLSRFNSLRLPEIDRAFIFHSSYNRTTTNPLAIQVATVHDFVHEKFYGGLRQKLHSYQKAKAINAAGKIIAVSNNTKNDLLELYPKVNPANVLVIYNGVSDDFYRLDNVISYRPYLVYIGSREHYKNFDFVIKLMGQMPEFDLYVIGSPFTSKENDQYIKPIANKVKLLTGITNAELNVIYNSATALLYPSSYEGFGIPLLEAMKAGLPFIALNKSSIPEVAGDAGELVDKLDIEAFKENIYKIVAKREMYVLKGLAQVSKFSWDECYRQTVKLYKEIS